MGKGNGKGLVAIEAVEVRGSLVLGSADEMRKPSLSLHGLILPEFEKGTAGLTVFSSRRMAKPGRDVIA